MSTPPFPRLPRGGCTFLLPRGSRPVGDRIETRGPSDVCQSQMAETGLKSATEKKAKKPGSRRCVGLVQ